MQLQRSLCDHESQGSAINRMMRRVLLSLCALPLLAASAAPVPPSFPTEDQLRSRYAVAGSQFASIDGENVHFTISGKGPAILLLHGSFASLRQWELWVKALSRRYTVVRYDQSPLGLSGPHPNADYTMEHRIKVIDALMDRARAKRFVIVGTSSAGVPAAAYAAIRPERISGVVLNNIAIGPVQFDRASQPEAMKASIADAATHPGWNVPEFWRQILLYNVVDKAVVTPALAAEWTELNNRMLQVPGTALAAARSTPATRTPADLAAIKAPTLFLWSADDHETTLDREGKQAFAMAGAKDKALVVVERCGHMMPLDCPARALAKALPFIRRVARR